MLRKYPKNSCQRHNVWINLAPKYFFMSLYTANLIFTPWPRHLAYREAQALGRRHAMWSLWAHPMLDSSNHMLCLGSTPVIQHSSASSSLALGWWCEKNPEIAARSFSLGLHLPQSSCLLQWSPVVSGSIYQFSNPFKRISISPNNWLLFHYTVKLCTKR